MSFSSFSLLNLSNSSLILLSFSSLILFSTSSLSLLSCSSLSLLSFSISILFIFRPKMKNQAKLSQNKNQFHTSMVLAYARHNQARSPMVFIVIFCTLFLCTSFAFDFSFDFEFSLVFALFFLCFLFTVLAFYECSIFLQFAYQIQWKLCSTHHPQNGRKKNWHNFPQNSRRNDGI